MIVRQSGLTQLAATAHPVSPYHYNQSRPEPYFTQHRDARHCYCSCCAEAAAAVAASENLLGLPVMGQGTPHLAHCSTHDHVIHVLRFALTKSDKSYDSSRHQCRRLRTAV